MLTFLCFSKDLNIFCSYVMDGKNWKTFIQTWFKPGVA